MTEDPEIVVIGPRKVSPKGRLLLHQFEGCRLEAYQDGGGVWTIGYGATGREIRKGLRWTQAQAEARFETDLWSREDQLNRLLDGSPCSQNQFDALFSLGYNVGMGLRGLGTSTLLGLHRKAEYAEAQLQFRQWNKDNGKAVKGLTNRRYEEAVLYGPRSASHLSLTLRRLSK